jgi:hypothetical protein
MQHADLRRRWIGALGFALALAAVTTYYVFVSTAGRFDRWPDLRIDDPYFYDNQAEGFRAGHLYTTLEPSPELLRRHDPYDARNMELWNWDYSLYRGRLYLYWGLAPAVLLAAFKALLSIATPVNDAVLVLLFLLGRLLAGAGLLRLLARQLTPRPPCWSVWLAWLVFALAHPTPFLLARPAVYEAALSGGACFLTMALWAGFSWLLVEPARTWLLVAASACLALAGTCRASLLPAAALILVLLLAFGLRRSPASRWPPRLGRSELRWSAAAFLPFSALVSAQLLVNQLRFGSWTEFGVSYQLGAPFQMGVRYVLANLWHYLFHVLEWHCQFPFLFARWTNTLPSHHDLPSWLPAPDHYRSVEPIVGVLSAVPFLWLIAAPVLISLVRSGAPDPRARAVWIVLGVASVTAAVPVLMLFAFSMRYEAEFMSPLLLLATLGGWSLLSLSSVSGPPRRGGRVLAWLGRSLYATVAGLSVLIGVTYGFSGYFGIFGRVNPALYQSLQRQLDLCPRRL